MVVTKNWTLIFFVSCMLLLSIYFLERYISHTQNVLYENLELSIVDDMSGMAQNIDNYLQDSLEKEEGILNYFSSSKDRRDDFTQRLSLLLTPKIQYLYLIYKDEKGKFRYLIDASSHEKAQFFETFDVEADAYPRIYESKKSIAIKQNTLENLSITYLYPILQNKKVVAVLVFDFSSAFDGKIRSIVAPLKKMFLFVYIIISLFLVITMVQTILYYKARSRSYVDALTGSYNRQYLRYFLDKNSIVEYKIMMIDFDYFKKINDNYGHDIGDKVLVFATQIISSCLSKRDILFRYGGEEFLVLVHVDDNVLGIAENIREKMQNSHFVEENVSLNMTVSIGINALPSHSRNTSQAINIADSMLLKAKFEGRNRVVAYEDEVETDMDGTHVIPHSIHEVVTALEQKKLICYFQKIIDTNNEVYKYEALVRYINEEDEMVYPNHFLSDILHTSVYMDVTKRVIDLCIETIQKKKVNVSLNLNVNDLLDKNLVEYLVEKVGTLEDEKAHLTIEILEHEAIENVQELQDILVTLKSQGIKIAIDDFGSGYANFNYLVDLNVDYVKIDGYLIESAVHSQKSKIIVQSIIDLAHEIQIKTIVEFVSSQAVYDLMVSLNADYMQGYFIAQPEEAV